MSRQLAQSIAASVLAMTAFVLLGVDDAAAPAPAGAARPVDPPVAAARGAGAISRS